jgi:hypothetical protein
MKDGNTTKITRKQAKSAKPDWTRLDAMTEAEKYAAALSDPDARPLKRTPRTKIIRRARWSRGSRRSTGMRLRTINLI